MRRQSTLDLRTRQRFFRWKHGFTAAGLLLLVMACPALRSAAARDAAARAEGPLRIRRIALSGLHTASAPDLQARLRPLIPRGRLSTAMRTQVSEQVAAAARAWLRGQGYLRATVRVVPFRPGAASFVVLRARINEGPHFRVGALDVTGVGPAIRLEAMRRLRLRSGQPLSAQDVKQSQRAVAQVLGDRGHAFVRVIVGRQPHRRSALVDVTFKVVPGPKARVGTIQVRGVSSTAELLIRRALLLRTGSAYHRTTLLQALARLRRTGAFRWIRLQEAREGPKRVRLIVTAQQK